jgi:class 3 adenylate cyclase
MTGESIAHSEVMSYEDTLQCLAVLYADISGSSRLYEQFGDATAQRDIVRCLTLLTEVAQAHGGRLEQTIGDEVMCSFVLPERAAEAAVAMHEKLREASAAKAFVSGTLRVRIGWHYGVAEASNGELGGALPIVAQQVTALSRPDEILASDAAVAALSSFWRDAAQRLDTIDSRVDGQPLTIYRLPWDKDEEVTHFRLNKAPTRVITSMRLILRHGERELVLNADHRRCSIGRGRDSDLATGSRFTSKRHAEVVYRRGRFYVIDNSINGTFIAPDGGVVQHLHHEEAPLLGTGVIMFGSPTTKDPDASVNYRCD